jgi:hypothetical protein
VPLGDHYRSFVLVCQAGGTRFRAGRSLGRRWIRASRLRVTLRWRPRRVGWPWRGARPGPGR